MLAALFAAPAANASVSGATAPARAPISTFTARLQVNHSGKCVDVLSGSSADGAYVQQWDCWPEPQQIWNFVISSDGYYTVRAVHSGKCLDVWNSSQAEGAKVQQGPCYNTTSLQWKLIQRPNGFFSLIARHSSKCLTVSGGSVSNGAAIIQQSCSSSLPNQEWRLL
nr:RICIN domain-containing protein [Streptomyces sp. HUCO-GS316]